jgi:3-phenylpropionate/trans-cinnamate dioxygenase ferredoxin reductase component
MLTNSTYVIVGAGLAGAKAAETLRAEGFGGRLLLVGGEGERPTAVIPLGQVTGDRAGALAARSIR